MQQHARPRRCHKRHLLHTQEKWEQRDGGKQKGGEQNGGSSFLTVVSFSLLAVGARDAQNAVDGVGSYGIVGGAGHWGRRCVGN